MTAVPGTVPCDVISLFRSTAVLFTIPVDITFHVSGHLKYLLKKYLIAPDSGIPSHSLHTTHQIPSYTSCTGAIFCSVTHSIYNLSTLLFDKSSLFMI